MNKKSDSLVACYFIGLLISLFSLVFTVITLKFDNTNEKHRPDALKEAELKGRNEEVSIFMIFQFSSLIWLFALIVLFSYAGTLQFYTIAATYFEDTIFNKIYTSKEAEPMTGLYMSFPLIVSTFVSPVAGSIVDAFGKRILILIALHILLILAFILIKCNVIIISLILIGIVIGFFPCIVFPSVAMLTEPNLISLVIGLMYSMMNLGLSIYPFLIAYIYSVYHTYSPVLS